MKTELPRPIAGLWQALSEVPGWPDAPLPKRLRRLWPAALPLLACLGVFVWASLVREPHRRDVRLAHAGVLGLEAEIETLQQAGSDQLATDLATALVAGRAQLLDEPAGLSAHLEAIATHARGLGWEMAAQVYGVSEDTPAAPGRPVFVPARLRLEPRNGHPDAFNSLMAVLSRIAATPVRLEITRLAVRADTPGQPGVDVNLRAACRPATDEETAQ